MAGLQYTKKCLHIYYTRRDVKLMQTLSIEASEHVDELVEWLKKGLCSVKEKHLDIDVSCICDSPDSARIICSVSESSASGEPEHISGLLKVTACNLLADFILWKYEEKLISRIINSNYCYFNALDKKNILNFAIENIKSDKSIFSSLYHVRRRNIIIRKLSEYFDSADSMVLDGFINFRLKDYMKELEEIVDKAVDDFLMEREYKEFIRLLKYFVEIQEPKQTIVHVLACYDGKYALLDENKNEIINECIREFANEVEEGEINHDDLLVSSLITLAPHRIVIHLTAKFRNKELLETIKSVFADKVTLCDGCDLCAIEPVKSEKQI